MLNVICWFSEFKYQEIFNYSDLILDGYFTYRDQPIFTTKAHVFQIDPETKKKWLPVSAQAVAVSFYHDTARNSYRILSFDGTNKVKCLSECSGRLFVDSF